MKREYWNSCYEMPQEEIPWEIRGLPREVEEWTSELSLPPGARILDVGCGLGNAARELAARKFRVTGIDISENAIEIARKKAEEGGLALSFHAASISSWSSEEKFDFGYDYSVFHHIQLSERPHYAAKVASLLKPAGMFGIVCYSESDPDAQGKPFRIGKYGNTIHHPTREELLEIFSPRFQEIEYGTTRLGKRRHHYAHRILLKSDKDSG